MFHFDPWNSREDYARDRQDAFRAGPRERAPFQIIFASMTGSVTENMRDRAARCRRLARTVLDKSASDALNQLAEEIEADMRRLQKSESPPT